MDVNKRQDGNAVIVEIVGRLNTNTAPQLERELQDVIGSTLELVLDCENLEYISSAGLRVILSTQKAMSRRRGSLVVRNVKPEIYEVFEMTGFLDFLTIE